MTCARKSRRLPTSTTEYPEIADDSETIVKQTDVLRDQYNRVKRQYDDLRAAVDAVNDSRVAKLRRMATTFRNYSITAVDGNGYTQEITVSIGPWIKGSEAEMLQMAWEGAGGEGQVPLSEAEGFTPSDAAYVVGTVSIRNLSTGFDAANFNNGQSLVTLQLLTAPGGATSSRRVDISNQCGATFGVVQYDTGLTLTNVVNGPLVNASMESDRGDLRPSSLALTRCSLPTIPMEIPPSRMFAHCSQARPSSR